MKRFFGIILACAFVALPAFAAKSQTVTIPSAVQVGSTQLPAGEYKVAFTGTGDDGKATISAKGITPVTVSAKVVAQKNDHIGVSIVAKDGKQVLQTIFLKSVNLVLE